MGVLESSFYNLPSLNIGKRQLGRENPGNVIFVKNNVKSILNGFSKIKKIKNKKVSFKKHFYGNKNSAKNIVNVIKSIDIKNPKWFNKMKLCV